ncbi:hypothetical protein Q5V23_001968 [Vibrio fluvialis]|nr:hypothetical protein [Vibrio fluvialis]
MHKTNEVMVELYKNSPIELFVSELREGVFSHLTDTVTLFAALVAIALPLAQQTFQWASDKYNSEHLVEYVETNAPVHPKSLSTSLILYVAFSFTFKLLSTPLNDLVFTLLLISLIIWFGINIALLIRYFAYTYDMGKGLQVIRERILDKKINLEQEIYTPVEISLLSDFEVYQLENNSHVGDFSSEFTEIRYHIGNRATKLDESVVSTYLAGMRRAVTSLPSTSSDRKYNFVVQNYIFLVQSLVCTHEKYFYLLDELVETAEMVEPYRKGNEKPLLQGLVFQNITYSDIWPFGVDRALVNHFNRLTQACIETGEIGQLVHLYDEFNKCLGYSSVDKGELQSHFDSFVESYEHYQTVDGIVLKIIENSDELSSQKIGRCLDPYIKGGADANREVLDEFCKNLGIYRYQEKAKKAVEEFLSSVAKVDLNIVLAIREIRNPISSNVHMLRCDLLPVSIDDVVICISKLGSDVKERLFRRVKFDQYLLTAYVTLYVYEITRIVVTENNVEVYEYKYVDKLTYRDLVKIKKRVAEVKSILGYVIGSESFSQLFYLHGVDRKDVTIKADKYLSGLLKETDRKIKTLSVSGKLDNESLQRFEDTIPSNDEVVNKYSYLISNRVKLSQYARFRYDAVFDRKSFLPNTGIYHAFGSSGWNVIDQHFEKILAEIAKSRKGVNILEAWPVNYGRLIFIHVKQQREMKKHGFKFENGRMYWPTGSSCVYHNITNDSNVFVNILPNESLVQITNPNDPLFEVEFKDKGKEITWSFTFNIMPYGYKYGQ